MKKDREKIILGIDPGTNIMGYGAILIRLGQLNVLQFGVVHLTKYTTHELKLKKIFERTSELLEDFEPDMVALEAPFYGKNVQSMLKLGRAQGVVMAAALTKEIPIAEYAPRKVKQSVAGTGNASKEQVASMLQAVLHFPEIPKHLDATDALAVALCHHYQGSSLPSPSKSWKSFLSQNPDRMKH